MVTFGRNLLSDVELYEVKLFREHIFKQFGEKLKNFKTKISSEDYALNDYFTVTDYTTFDWDTVEFIKSTNNDDVREWTTDETKRESYNKLNDFLKKITGLKDVFLTKLNANITEQNTDITQKINEFVNKNNLETIIKTDFKLVADHIDEDHAHKAYYMNTNDSKMYGYNRQLQLLLDELETTHTNVLNSYSYINSLKTEIFDEYTFINSNIEKDDFDVDNIATLITTVNSQSISNDETTQLNAILTFLNFLINKLDLLINKVDDKENKLKFFNAEVEKAKKIQKLMDTIISGVKPIFHNEKSLSNDKISDEKKVLMSVIDTREAELKETLNKIEKKTIDTLTKNNIEDLKLTIIHRIRIINTGLNPESKTTRGGTIRKRIKTIKSKSKTRKNHNRQLHLRE
jgi:hypothetical protein